MTKNDKWTLLEVVAISTTGLATTFWWKKFNIKLIGFLAIIYIIKLSLPSTKKLPGIFGIRKKDPKSTSTIEKSAFVVIGLTMFILSVYFLRKEYFNW